MLHVQPVRIPKHHGEVNRALTVLNSHGRSDQGSGIYGGVLEIQHGFLNPSLAVIEGPYLHVQSMCGWGRIVHRVEIQKNRFSSVGKRDFDRIRIWYRCRTSRTRHRTFSHQNHRAPRLTIVLTSSYHQIVLFSVVTAITDSILLFSLHCCFVSVCECDVECERLWVWCLVCICEWFWVLLSDMSEHCIWLEWLDINKIV